LAAALVLTQRSLAGSVALVAPCRDYFRHLTVENFLRKVVTGEISIPVSRMERSQKTAKGVHINDLAAYLDTIAAAARKECEQLRRNGP
jgi:hypothetical protein